MSHRPEGPLRRGWTTGACATAATRAAYTALLTGRFPDPVAITLPKGQTPSFALAQSHRDEAMAEAGIVKDAGDDPDVTHGALILSRVRRGADGSGVTFRAGEGVGTVTRAGLELPVGEPAINPVPRRMMTETVREVAEAHDDTGDVEIEIAIPGGEEMARNTLNGRLGIVGGLSVLGTTGIVTPYSCSSWIHSIHRGIDVARAAGLEHAAAATGSVSEAAVQALYGLPETGLLDMGDFAGGLLKYLRKHPIPNLTIAGGFAKLAKLAQGHMDLHSGRSQLDMAKLAELAGQAGAGADLKERIAGANTGRHALDLAGQSGLPLADAVAEAACKVARKTVGKEIRIEVLVFDRAGLLIGTSETRLDP